MARRRNPPDPELAALARERLRRLLDVPAASEARRAVTPAPAGRPTGSEPPEMRPPPMPTVGLDDLEPPRRFTRWHLGVVAVVLVVGLVWGGWSLLRARPQALASVAVPATVETTVASSATSPSAGEPSGAAATTQTAAVGLVVHVLGAVREPGLVRLATGARVEDAIKAAGGLTRDADPAELNLAQPLGDGEQVVIGTRTHPAGEVRSEGGSGSTSGGGSGSVSGSGGGGSTATVDLNRASADQLEALPGVGPVTAQKIVAWRQQHGRFSKPEELQEVDGIGPKTYAQIAPHVRV